MQNQILKNANAICDNFNQGQSNVKLEICTDAELIANFYKTYDGIKEFLYIPPLAEVQETIANGNAVYYVIKYDGQLAGVAKAGKLSLPYPFFCTPKSMDPKKDYWGLSGLYIHKAFQGKKLSTVLLKASTSLAEVCRAEGIYADFDYRNLASMQLISKYYDLLGYTDGRNGSPDEATIYTTFYKNFSNTSEKAGNLNIYFEELKADNARDTLDCVMEGIGTSTINVVPYCGGYNEVVCFDKPYSFEQSNIKMAYDIRKTLRSEKSLDK